MVTKLLILGGTQIARQLAAALAPDPRYRALLSYAGRTENPQLPDLPHRVGGFGGAVGLAQFLRDYDALVDATHPFAARISSNAVGAAESAGVPLLRLVRPAWQPQPGDRWLDVPDMDGAARALGEVPKRVFLTIGRQEVAAFRRAPQHFYLARSVDAFDPGLPHAEVLTARGPFSLAHERALLERARIDLLVSKNAGTGATEAKLRAARELGLPVIMVSRPALPAATEVATVEHALSWLARLHGSERGE
jgi:precorrin-6A/cobalt-precorrin-6A reductase